MHETCRVRKVYARFVMRKVDAQYARLVHGTKGISFWHKYFIRSFYHLFLMHAKSSSVANEIYGTHNL